MSAAETEKQKPVVRASAHQFRVYGAGAAWSRARNRLDAFVRRAATVCARKSGMTPQDLVEVGFLAIWELDPSRYHADDERYLQRGVYTSMLRQARRERAERRRRKKVKRDRNRFPCGADPDVGQKDSA